MNTTSKMDSAPYCNVFMYFIVCFSLLLNSVESQPLDSKNNVIEKAENHTAVKVCKNEIVGSKGSISPQISEPGFICEWTIDVTKGNMIELDFEMFRLPYDPDHICDSHIEIYENQDDPIKRVFCSTDRINKMILDTHVITIKYVSGTHIKKQDRTEYGFKINYTAVPVPKSSSSRKVAEILIFTFAAVLVFAVCVLLFRCTGLLCGWKRTPRDISALNEAPGQIEVPNQRQFNKETYAIPRKTYPEPQHEMKTMSEASSFKASLSRWSSYEHLPAAPNRDQRMPNTDIPPHRSYTMTPNFPGFKGKLGDISNVRTKLVARFSTSSANTSDISVFFPAFSRSSDSRLYSQISNEDQDVPTEKCPSSSKGEQLQKVPSIVISYVE